EASVLKCQRRLGGQSLEGIQRGRIERYPVGIPIGRQNPDSLALSDEGKNSENSRPKGFDLVVRRLEAKLIRYGEYARPTDRLFCELGLAQPAPLPSDRDPN